MSKVNIEGLNKNDAITLLITEGDMDFKAASQYWADNRPKTAVGWTAQFYARLRLGVMSDSDFEEVLATGSENVQKHKSHYDAIRLLANDIHSA